MTSIEVIKELVETLVTETVYMWEMGNPDNCWCGRLTVKNLGWLERNTTAQVEITLPEYMLSNCHVYGIDNRLIGKTLLSYNQVRKLNSLGYKVICN